MKKLMVLALLISSSAFADFTHVCFTTRTTATSSTTGKSIVGWEKPQAIGQNQEFTMHYEVTGPGGQSVQYIELTENGKTIPSIDQDFLPPTKEFKFGGYFATYPNLTINCYQNIDVDSVYNDEL